MVSDFKKVGINVWDDYAETSDETRISIENNQLSDQEKKDLLTDLMPILQFENNTLILSLEQYDSYKAHPNLQGVMPQVTFWQIGVKGLDHESREDLVEHFEENPVFLNGYKLDIYSES